MKLLRLILMATVLMAAYIAVLAVAVIPYGWVVALGLALGMARKKKPKLSAHGTSRYAITADMPHMLDAPEGSGVILGHTEEKIGKREGVKALFSRRLPAKQAVRRFLASCQRKKSRHLVQLTKAVHIAGFAPTGVGKTSSLVLPHLLTCPDSMAIVDFKGELVRETAAARQRMGHRVAVLDPFNVVGGKDTFNPLDWIDKDSRTALDDCRDLAAAMVLRTGEDKDAHWSDSAELWITAMIAMVLAHGEDGKKSFQTVRRILTKPDAMQDAMRVMCESEAWEGMLARYGNQLTHYKDKELGSTITTTNRHLKFLDTLAIADSTKRSSFNPSELLSGKMTIYLVLPPEHQRAQSSLLRLWIGSLLRAVIKGGLQDQRKVRFILDEAASLGHMEQLDDAVDKFRGYGIRLLFLYQSLGQLKVCWPKGQEQTLLSNVTQVFFGVNDPETAEYVSKRLGQETILVESGGSSSGRSTQHSQQGSNFSYSSNTNYNWAQHGRSLLQPSEVIALPERLAITFTPGVPPIATWLARHYENDFRADQGIRLWKAIFDTACLFISVTILAALITAALVDLITK
ncbi:type IV secretory system conjugative DNA transfer family protein [Fimbriiglobus ruber]|uniref:Conjugal transfer coupling protein TraG n=1 Tax=Fimbriiglobus ruber TaxID=1908690 RepID=A0A225DKY2_9BACT|nr:type IV secretory system conjugative DNA transfer family protein [Fimbriiglobus ruber]OWK42101.1 Conjugal transfer coupling protein TraG [Fimbriiglobus ruber]